MIPQDCGLVHAFEPQMDRLRGRKDVVLVLGHCRKGNEIPSIEHPYNLTEQMVKCLEVDGHIVLMLDHRQSCRQHGKGRCEELLVGEAREMNIATCINLEVAFQEYGIGFKSIISFAESWYDNLTGLLYLEKRLERLPRYHIDSHLAWLGSRKQGSHRMIKIDRTRTWKELCVELSNRKIIDAVDSTIYGRFYDLFHDIDHLSIFPWDYEIPLGDIKGLTDKERLLYDGMLAFEQPKGAFEEPEVSDEEKGDLPDELLLCKRPRFSARPAGLKESMKYEIVTFRIEAGQDGNASPPAHSMEEYDPRKNYYEVLNIGIRVDNTTVQCPKCEKTWTGTRKKANDLLRNHLNGVHTEEVCCVYCNNWYKKGNNIRQHLKREHKIVPIKRGVYPGMEGMT